MIRTSQEMENAVSLLFVFPIGHTHF